MQTTKFGFSTGAAILCAVLLCACSATRDMQVLVTRPAVMQLPTEMKRLLIVDRSRGNASTILEGILTGELPGRDGEQSSQCLSGLQQTLNTYPGLAVARHTERLSSARGNSAGFGTPMDWTEIGALAVRYQADALLVLEYFDTDFSVRDAIGFNSLPDVFVRGTARASSGFRLYDPVNRAILYEKGFANTKFYQEHAPNRALAVAKLIKGADALNEASFVTGRNFGWRLVDHSVWEDRLMFKGKGNAARGERFALANEWQRSIDTWLNAYKNADDDKEKGKIAYNLALGYEVLGDLQEAKKWIVAAYIEHENRKAFDYSAIINRRIENEGILEARRNQP